MRASTTTTNSLSNHGQNKQKEEAGEAANAVVGQIVRIGENEKNAPTARIGSDSASS
jgi:hypothetical protein